MRTSEASTILETRTFLLAHLTIRTLRVRARPVQRFWIAFGTECLCVRTQKRPGCTRIISHYSFNLQHPSTRFLETHSVVGESPSVVGSIWIDGLTACSSTLHPIPQRSHPLRGSFTPKSAKSPSRAFGEELLKRRRTGAPFARCHSNAPAPPGLLKRPATQPGSCAGGGDGGRPFCGTLMRRYCPAAGASMGGEQCGSMWLQEFRCRTWRIGVPMIHSLGD